jgi:hypothetical protein
MIFKELATHSETPWMRIWGAIHGGLTWIIVYDGLSDEYTATCRKESINRPPLLDGTLGADTDFISGGPWGSFTEAEAACNELGSRTTLN